MDTAAKLKAVAHLQTKIQKTREKIKIEQNNKEIRRITKTGGFLFMFGLMRLNNVNEICSFI